MHTDQLPHVTESSAGRDDDLAAIAQIIGDIETAMNTNDAVLAVRHFAADARAVDVRGREHVGADVLLAVHREGYAGHLADQFARYDLADVVFLDRDVALAWKHATATDEDGTPIGVGHAMVALYVLVRAEGRWWIAARQATLVPG